jgi:hypothetical protein
MFDLSQSTGVPTLATLSRGFWRAAAGLACVGTLLTLAPLAQAQRLGDAEVFAITGEELTGFTTESSKYDDVTDRAETVNTTRFNLALSNGARIGVHYFYWSRVSLGGTLGFASEDGSASVPDNNGTYTDDRQADTTLWVLPKIGYLLPFSDKAGFWFRGGPGLHRTHVHPARYNAWQQTETHWLLEVDALFVFTPVPVVGLLVGPVGDLGLIGYHTEEHVPGQNRANYRFSHPGSYYRFGIWAGLVVMLW